MRLPIFLPALLLLAAAAQAQTLPATTAPTLLPVPDEKSQDDARLMIANVFKGDFAKTDASSRHLLAEKFLSQAKESRDVPTARYVLLQTALDLASVAGDPAAAFAAATQLAQSYAVDSLDVKKRALFRSNVATLTPAGSEVLAGAALDTADEAARLDDFNSVQQLVNLAESAANRTQKISFVASVQPRLNDLRGLITDYPDIKKAVAHLEETTADAEAHLLVGRFYALRKGQWNEGLPHLAACSDDKLRSLALQDLSNPRDGIQQAALGDAWWDFAQSAANSIRANCEGRARFWYAVAKPNLAGITLTRIQSRLGGAAPSAPAPPSTESTNLLTLIDTNKDVAAGKWIFANNTLQCTAPSRNALIAIPYVPADEYDLRFTFARTDGDGSITVLLPSHGKSFGFALDIKAEARFERVANKIGKDNPTAVPVVVSNNHRYTLTLQIHRDAVRALLDDKPLTQWKTDYKDLSHYAVWKLPDEKVLALGVNNAKVTVFDMELTELGGKGRPAR